MRRVDAKSSTFAGLIAKVRRKRFRAYQTEWKKRIRASAYFALLGGRQIGKDWSISDDVCETSILPSRSHRSKEWHVVSATNKHSKDVIRDIKRWHTYYTKLGARFGYEVPALEVANNKTELGLSNGSVVQAHAARTASVTGFRDSVWLNECALIPDFRNLMESCVCIVRSARQNGKPANLILTSNASWRGSEWHEVWQDINLPGSTWNTLVEPWEEAMRSWGKSEAWIATEKRDILATLGGSVSAYNMWFGCIFRAALDGFLDPQVLRNRLYDPDLLTLRKPYRSTIGYDVGLDRDPAAVSRIWLPGNNRRYAEAVRQYVKLDYDEQLERVFALTDRGVTLSVTTDSQGTGHGQAKRIAKKFRGSGVKAVDFATGGSGRYSKLDLFTGLRVALDTGVLWLDQNDVDTLMQLEAVTLTRTKNTNKPTVDIPRTKDRDGNMCHGDRAFALALANHGAEAKNQIPAPRAPDRARRKRNRRLPFGV